MPESMLDRSLEGRVFPNLFQPQSRRRGCYFYADIRDFHFITSRLKRLSKFTIKLVKFMLRRNTKNQVHDPEPVVDLMTATAAVRFKQQIDSLIDQSWQDSSVKRIAFI